MTLLEALDALADGNDLNVPGEWRAHIAARFENRRMDGDGSTFDEFCAVWADDIRAEQAGEHDYTAAPDSRTKARQRNDGGPAFPSVMEGGPLSEMQATFYPGASLRDYFAGKALPTVIQETTPDGAFISPQTVAARCYEAADAMLKERQK